jgi:hypothetical protein
MTTPFSVWAAAISASVDEDAVVADDTTDDTADDTTDDTADEAGVLCAVLDVPPELEQAARPTTARAATRAQA